MDIFRCVIENIVVKAATFSLVVCAFTAVNSVSAATTITVDSTVDFAEVDGAIGREDSYTCTYTVGTGAIYKAAPNGVCTLRRAVLEAGVRPDADRPYYPLTLVFQPMMPIMMVL